MTTPSEELAQQYGCNDTDSYVCGLLDLIEEDGPASAVQAYIETGLTAAPEIAIEALTDVIRYLTERRDELVPKARADSYSWSAIGGWLRLSRQAAQQRYGKHSVMEIDQPVGIKDGFLIVERKSIGVIE